MSSNSVGNAKAAATPVKWTLVEAVADTPRKGKKGNGERARQGGRGSSSSSVDNWRQPRGGSGGGGSGGGGSSRNSNQRSGQGRGRGYGRGRGFGYGRGYGAYVGGATYYPPNNYGAENPSEEQKAYMTSMAVKQIEFYFTVENLCKDIFIRSYMDEEGYIPIAFVANFPGVARFGVELADITAGILASDTLQVDTENETMRMRENWEVWLLPNQATGKQGVPRYIKVDPATVSEEAATTSIVDATQAEESQTSSSDACANDAHESKETRVKSGEGVPKKEVEASTEPAVQGEQQSISASAPAWTPGGVVTDVATTPVASPCDDNAGTETATPEKKGGGEDGGSSGVAVSETAAPAKNGSGKVGDSSDVTIEPKPAADMLNP